MTKDSLRIAVVSPYPPPNAKHVYGSGVAAYTKNLAEALRSVDPKIEIHVIADRKEGLPRLYTDNGVIVHRVYDKRPIYILQIFKELCKIKPDAVHIQHEYFLYGGLVTAALFPLLVALSKLVSKKVVVTIHGVIPLKLLEDQEFKKENGIQGPSLILKLGLMLVTKLIVLLSDKVIVHEQFLKKYLVKDYKENPRKIIVIPHGVEDLKPLPKDKAKEKLGLRNKIVLLYFGYLTGYKGIKELLETYEKISVEIPNTILIIAGGPHPRLAGKRWYKDWMRSIIKRIIDIQQRIDGRGKIILTGYVPEDKLPIYFSAADMIILPYKARIAASGPEALAIAFERPCITIHVKYLIKNYDKIANLITMLKTDLFDLVKHLKETRKWLNIAKIHLSYVYRLAQ